MAQTWDLSDPSMRWDIERELRILLETEPIRYYGGVFKGKVESLSFNCEGIAHVDMYGRNNDDPKGHYHFRLRLFPEGSFLVLKRERVD